MLSKPRSLSLLGMHSAQRHLAHPLPCFYYNSYQWVECALRVIHNTSWVCWMAGICQRMYSCTTVLKWQLIWQGTGAWQHYGFRGTWMKFVMAWPDRQLGTTKFLLNALDLTSNLNQSGYNFLLNFPSISSNVFELSLWLGATYSVIGYVVHCGVWSWMGWWLG